MPSTAQHDWVPHNTNGGLTLVPMPGYEGFAKTISEIIEAKGKATNGRLTGVDIAYPKFGLRPSGECFPRLGKNHVGGHDCYIITSGPGTNDMLMKLIYLVGILAARKASRINIVSGYFPHSRSDKDEGEEEIAIPPIIMGSLHGVAQGLLKRIISADPHSLQVGMADDPGVITSVFLTEKILGQLLSDAEAGGYKRICLAFPDDSACKRYEKAIEATEKKLGHSLSVVVTFARRKSSRDKRVKYIVGDTDDLKDALVIALDDETATGGSQINAAHEFVQKYGAKEVWAAVTHGVLCENAPQLFSAPGCPISRLYVVDTIPVVGRSELDVLIASGRLHTISWVRDIGLVIYDDHWNESIRGNRSFSDRS